jgi:hypothetical protein
MEFPPKLKTELRYDSAIQLQGIHQRNTIQHATEIPTHPCLSKHYSQ